MRNLRKTIFSTNQILLRFSSIQGGLVESKCAQFHEIPALPLDKDVLTIIRQLQQSPTPRITATAKLREKQQNQISHLLGHFMAHHLNIEPSIRQIALTDLNNFETETLLSFNCHRVKELTERFSVDTNLISD